MEGREQIQRSIFNLRNSLDLYLERGNVEDVEKIRATIAHLEYHLKILDEWKRESGSKVNHERANHGS